MILPLNETESTRMNERSNEYAPFKKRHRNPTINIQKYPTKVEVDDQDRPVGFLPDMISDYFQVVTFPDDFFYTEMTARFKDVRIAVREARYPNKMIIVASLKIISLIQTRVSTMAKINANMK